MKRLLLGTTLLGLVGFAAPPAFADVINAPTQFSTLQVGGVYTPVGDLIIQNGGSILCNDTPGPDACDIKIIVDGNMRMETSSAILAENNTASGSGGDIEITVSGDFLMQAGTKISSSDTTGGGTTGNAGNITITVGDSGATPPTGTFTMEPGSQILANSANRSAGAIVIDVARTADLDGLVESFGGMTGVGANQPPGGGPITVTAGCDLTVSDTGKISSRGQDPGADLVRLKGGCIVNIFGLVESTGVGHAEPNNPPNHCHDIGSLQVTACVEILAGDLLTIDSKNHNGEVNADTGGPGGSTGTSYIDIFARGPISIIGDSVLPFAVHANGKAGTNDDGGYITVKSRDANVLATDLALQADATAPGGSGGHIVVEAATQITLNTAWIFARGDFNAGGGYGNGGSVAIRSFEGNLSWQNGVGDVRPTGDGILLAKRGTITIHDCNGGAGFDDTGTVYPAIGNPVNLPDVQDPGACGGNPVVPVLPDCLCAFTPGLACISVTKVCTDAAAPGEPITFQGTVQNCGSQALIDITLEDSVEGGPPASLTFPTTLAVGASDTYSGQYIPTVSPSEDTVTATGFGADNDQEVTATASAVCTFNSPTTGEGCTPGYWKNHPAAWAGTAYETTDTVGSVFSSLGGACPSLASKTLLQALSLRGGSTFCKKVEILLRAGVAAILNASSLGITYPIPLADVIDMVNQAILSGNKSTVTSVASQLDQANNLGCPF